MDWSSGQSFAFPGLPQVSWGCPVKSGPTSSQSAKSPSQASTPARAAAPAPAEAAPSLTSVQRGLVGGSALPSGLRTRMEAGFSTSFGDVRVHTGGAAASSTSTFRAEAFTSGTNIAFAPGRFNPGSKSGEGLIAHELAHVVQQRRSGGGGAVQAKSLVSGPGDAAETAADQAAATVLAGGRANVSGAGQSLRGRIMRRARLGAAPMALSPAMTQAPSRPGAAAPGAGPVLTPVMTSQVSAAGGMVSGLNRGGAGPAAAPKAPDEAQTARGQSAAEAKSPPGAMVAGSPVGAGEGEKTGGSGKKKAKGKDKSKDKAAAGGPEADKGEAKEKDGKKKKKARKKAHAAARGGGGGGGGSVGSAKRFGQNLGDRGAAAADEAKDRLTAKAGALRRNEGAETRISDARAAAEPPANAAEVDGKRTQAGTLAAAPVASPDAAAAQARSKSALAAVAPSTIEELDDFAGSGGAATRNSISQTVANDAASQAAPVQTAMSTVSTPPTGVTPEAAVQQPEPMGAGGAAAPGLGAAAPAPVPEESLDASEYREEADGALGEHDVDDATLAKADEGPLRAIGDDKTQLDANVDTAAGDARATEGAATGAAMSGLQGAESESVGGMEAGRIAGQEAVSGEQTGTRTGEQLGEQTLAEQISALYGTAEAAVNQKLSSLQTDAVKSFRDRQAQRLEAFASGVRTELDAFKKRRYAGVRGKVRRLRDWVMSINSLSEVKALYERNRKQYITAIDAMLVEIKDGIQRTIDECKQTLADAKTEIDRLVTANKGKLDTDAQAALDRSNQQFAKMEARIEATRKATLAALDHERERAIQEMDAKLSEIQAENAGLVDKIANAIKALAALLGTFMKLLARVTRMGIGNFLSAAGSQAKEGVRNNLWDALKEAFQEWIFSKVPGLQLLMNLPPNWLDMLSALATNMLGLFMESLPAMLPVIGAAAMIWLATQLALKLIPGAGAIMAVIDAIRAAWGLVQSLFSAASAFFDFVMKVAQPSNGAASFAKALAHGIVAVVDMVLTFLGVDALIKRVLGAIAKPFGKVIQRLQQRFRKFMDRRKARRQGRTPSRRRDGGRSSPGDANRRRRAESDARRRDRNDDRRRRDRDGDGKDKKRKESREERRRREREERDRQNRERLARAASELPGKIRPLLSRGTPGLFLRARLAIWRLQYRLSALEIDRSGRGFQIHARVNPDQVVVAGVTFGREELLVEVRKIAQQVARDPRVISAEVDIRAGQRRTQTRAQQRSGSDTLVTNVSDRTNIAGLHNVNMTAPLRRKGQVEDVNIGGDGGFRRTQRKGGARNQTVSGVSGTALDYNEALALIQKNPQWYGEALRRFGQRTGGAVPGLDMAAAVEHFGIRFQEAQRSPAMLAHMPFEQMMLARGQADRAILDHPAYGEDSTKRMGAVDRNLARRAGLDQKVPDWDKADSKNLGGREARGSTAKQIEKEFNYIAAAIAARGLMFNNKQEALVEIRRLVFAFFQMGVLSATGPIQLGDGSGGDE